jgi:TolB-like protein
VLVAVRRVSTAYGLKTWSEFFDGTTRLVFDMQRYIAAEVAEALR